ncbi:MAG: Mur ligase family protein [Patescibacteria group bacterium]
MIIRTFNQAEEYLNGFISKGFKYIFQGEIGLERVKDFLKLLGNPQEKLKIIHVAGTSGKGSTCYLISFLLKSHGFKVGLHQSPHLTDVRERFQINNQIISKKEFIFYLNKIIPIIDEACLVSTKLSYFEILVGLAFYIFAEKKVDYAVIETGLGGLYDATNTISRSDKLSVLTKIGLDHMNVLGKIIEKIAYQKAMIINKNSQAISIKQDPKAEKVIKEIAEEKKAKIMFVDVGNAYMRSVRRGRFYADPNIFERFNLIGDYQKENANLALAAVNYLSQRDGFEVDKEKVGVVFQTAYFPGRFDVKKIKNKTVIFDGAHNPQKMEAFISSLIKKYPDKKFNFLLAFKKGKDYKEMLKIIISCAIVHKIIITSFLTENQDMINSSEDPIVVGNAYMRSVRGGRFYADPIIIPNLKNAWETILQEDEPIVVTGSLYLVGEVFRLIKTNK